MNDVSSMFGCMVFNDRVMRERLPKDTYRNLKKTIQDGKPLDSNVANIVANAMKDWAIEKGATHYTHWFQPMTEVTAEKHDAFLSNMPDGSVIMEFDGKHLIRSEPDASSLPSGGLRATFEARGYTAWDPTSYAFIKDHTLCIPTAFCSYGGQALDKKTPLLRSMEALSIQAMRILRLFGNTSAKRVITSVGPEQEYFLIDKALFDQRKDLYFTGRTLFGAKPPKGQELDDHYFGSIKPRALAFMEELNQELWKLGISAKTEHNETAPSQYELACIYATTNVATDQNQLIMEMMKKLAPKHGLACLLHEKPFAGVNGSGKHNNWSMATDTGINLLEPGQSPYENAQFLLFLCAVLKAVDKHQDLLRISAATAANEHRLGATEAPPAIISVHLGEEITDILRALESGTVYDRVFEREMKFGARVLPPIPKDTTDRNRTSPFAFTGNKFEFRMVGSTQSVAGPNFIINTIVADALCQFADALEAADDFTAALNALIKSTIQKHKRIIFNGNNYSQEWVEEAQRRGLLNLQTTAQALPYFIRKENIDLFEKFGVLSSIEIHSRYEILLEKYSKTLSIEALTMLEMVRKEILPAVLAYTRELSETALSKKSLSDQIPCELEIGMVTKLSSLCKSLDAKALALDNALLGVKDHKDPLDCVKYYREVVFTAMQEVRAVADQLEVETAKKYWPFPTYGDLLFSL